MIFIDREFLAMILVIEGILGFYACKSWIFSLDAGSVGHMVIDFGND